MNPISNPALFQKQLRDNANDLQDFCKDLKSWGEEMKQKEQAMREQKDHWTEPSPSKSPEPLGKIMNPELLGVKEKPNRAKDVVKLKGATDYNSWEQYDADLECAKLEEDLEDDSELTDEYDYKAKDEAHVEKEKGNKHVRNEEWDKAIECYTKAIKLYSYDPVYYANRALCFLKTFEFQKAIEDCTLSLRLDNTYVKAYQRRASARERLYLLDSARDDLLKVLQYEPKNKESLAAFQRVCEKLGISKQVPPQRPVSKFTASRKKTRPSLLAEDAERLLASIDEKVRQQEWQERLQKQKQKEQQERQEQERREQQEQQERQEQEGQEQELRKQQEQQEPEEKPKIDTSQPSTTWLDDESKIILVKPTKKPAHLQSKKPLKRIQIEEIEIEPAENGNAVKDVVIENKPPTKIGLIKSEPRYKKTSKQARAMIDMLHESVDRVHRESKNVDPKHLLCNDPDVIERRNYLNSLDPESEHNPELKVFTRKKTFAVPKTSVQFYAAWGSLQSDEDKYWFLKGLDPMDLPDMFKEALEPKVFSEMLRILAKCFTANVDDVYKFLFAFTLVKRFTMLVKLMSVTDKQHLIELFNYVMWHEGKGEDLKMFYEIKESKSRFHDFI